MRTQGTRRLTVKSIATSLPGFSIVIVNHALHTEGGGGCTDDGIWVIIADFGQFEATRKVGSHNFAASFVEDWLLDSRIGGAKSFPVPKCCI
jgi:hypothetical protein